ncbi:MAG: hypothetical protein PHI34_09360 [Acidobacteriota bacterium]|nr:hypothetical protein [Acidobacteriota bacterium]
MTKNPGVRFDPAAPPAGRRGAVLFISMLAVLVLTMLALPVLVRVSENHRLAEKDFRETSALTLAEAGIDRAIWELNYGTISSWSGTTSARTLDLSSVATSDGTTAGGVSVTVSNPSSNNPVVVATGTVAWTGGQTVTRRVRVVLEHGFKSFFDFGVFGDDGFDLHGNAYIDSYNSGDGAYDPANYRSRGNVGTNAGEHWDVVLLNNTIVHGDAATGYESNPEDVIRLANAATITGEKTALSAVKPLPPITAPSLTARGALTTTTGSTGTVITESGTYTSFTMANNSKVTISGDVTLYIDGNFLMDANSTLEITPGSTVEIILGNGTFEQRSNTTINNLTRDAKALAILGTSDFTSMIWNANSGFYGVVYAPYANIDYAANGDFFGSLVCNYLSLSSETGIHYDESLAAWEKYGTTSTSYVVKSWQPWD